MPRKRAGNKLEKFRVVEGLTKAELARLAGISSSTIRDGERENRELSEVTKHKIVRALNKRCSRDKPYSVEEVF